MEEIEELILKNVPIDIISKITNLPEDLILSLT